jgi:hypothetical protein
MTQPPHDEPTRLAIALLTAWTDDDPDFSKQVLAQLAEEGRIVEVFDGLINVAGYLVVQLARQYKKSESEVIALVRERMLPNG